MHYPSGYVLCVIYIPNDDRDREFVCFELVLGKKSFVYIDTHCSVVDKSMMMKVGIVKED